MSDKVDLKKDYKSLYTAKQGVCVLVEVPQLSYLMLDGAGDPNAAPFAKAVEALYGVAYSIKFARKKKGLGPDYAVMPLEGLWSVAGGNFSWDAPKSSWRWTLMIAQPSFVSVADASEAVCALECKQGEAALLSLVRLEDFAEGPCAQTLHVGPYAGERPTVEALLAFARGQGYVPSGRHHEIYLNDPRRAAPAKLKTILRTPVRRA
ncbi:MAG: GyrI-like domain-containing protein [Desulfovibrionaceae bacterium]|nr:GyrI-like domain-containing protein [Desulfovibrionaceae bacterium]MBF0513513.1 GyrI-like domain-containing protein [Desulfovibrionaceae bacterium]